MVLAPLGAMLVQMAISRTREYAADDLGARICGQPMWLASALSKIASAAHQVPNMEAERNPATAHMFIINPLSGHGMDNLFTTHPSTPDATIRTEVHGAGRHRADRGDEPVGRTSPPDGHSLFVTAGLKREARLRARCPGHPDRKS